MKTPDSLMMFVQSAMMFLNNEVRIPVSEEVVKHMIIHHFDQFSAAYSRYRVSADESSRRQIAEIIKKSERLHSEAVTRAHESSRNIPV